MRDWEAMSAYLDNQLKPKDRVLLESRLEKSPELRSAFDELRRTRAVLRNQKSLRAPRNFALTAEMAGIRTAGRRSARPDRQLVPGIAPGFCPGDDFLHLRYARRSGRPHGCPRPNDCGGFTRSASHGAFRHGWREAVVEMSHLLRLPPRRQ